MDIHEKTFITSHITLKCKYKNVRKLKLAVEYIRAAKFVHLYKQNSSIVPIYIYYNYHTYVAIITDWQFPS